MGLLVFVFFFSSRRRHTRSYGDWSSDVCSSDLGLDAAIEYIEGIGRAAIFEHDGRLAEYAMERLAELPGMRVLGPSGQRGALVGFLMDSAHPHDLTTFADQHGLALRGGHHCNQPLMRRFGVPGTTRASFYFYNTTEEIDRMIEILRAAVRFFS